MPVTFVTYHALPHLSDDDRLAADALAQRGVDVVPARWDDPAVRWEAFDLVVVRSCWDYHLRAPEMRAWLDRLDATGARTWNPTALLRWNMDKRYLRDIAARGIPVVPTRWVAAGDDVTLAGALAERGWARAVVKPVVSASAHDTWVTTADRAVEDEARFREVARGGAMVQGFVDAVVEDGEWSVIFFRGRFSHAVLKRPRAGDFRVQAEKGGTATLTEPPPGLVDAAMRALAAAPTPTLYARVDGCMVDGAFVLMELELLEPSLFLACDPTAAARFADAIVDVSAATSAAPPSPAPMRDRPRSR
jgi:glutathione synthase/RimK-type ligase-like ATP-grasp enzyme